MTTLNFPTAEEIDGFATGFYGYGDFEAPLWFIGMEEGGGNSAREVTNRIHVWQQRGCAPLEDVAEYHDAVFENGFNSITKQNTWSALSRIQLAYNSDPVSGMSVRNHWQQQLGRRGSATCIMELNPLPSPSITTWKYPDFTDLPFLASRIAYNARYRADRIASIKDMLAQHEPKAVIFYGKKYERFWAEIAGATFETENLHSRAVKGDTTFVSMHHPNARVRGKTSNYLENLGSMLRDAS
ncbi:hypothetical protein [Celeribacter halophilus]|uniref:hypothetical protein n=1 Tax=Celeribacter halophilus TaxID=576117 RepID=UPI001C08B880|nr:hypothetical protein [Celeribacter halophilus]MBU2890580.1 hypothetical protein [Celeribacter halophilus]MDO6510256.1 hypothetical protein [Celeribacter halophilus]